MELIDKGSTVKHLAGIIPIAGQPLEFNMPWHDSMMPMGANYFAIEKSVYECAMAGCETIWIVAHYGLNPMIKKRIGNFVVDPCSFHYISVAEPKKLIPIYYVPIHPKDKKKRDSLAWSVLYGAYMAHRVANFLTKWIVPEKFYCSFPYGVTDPSVIRSNRLIISNVKKTVFRYNGKTVKDNLHMNFTFDPKDYFVCRDIAKQKGMGHWKDHRENAALYDLETVFKGLDHTNADVIELPWFYDTSTWDGYRTFLGSEHAKLIKRPDYIFTRHKKRMPFNEQPSGEEVQQNQPTSETENVFT